MSFNMNSNSMYNNWNNMYNANNMNMNNFINTNMGMNSINNPMALQMNIMLQNFYNQMAQLQSMNFNNQANMINYSVSNNAKATDRLPTHNENTPFDPFPNHPGKRSNFVFQTSKGFKISIPAPFDVSVHQVLVEYIKRVGLGPNALYDGFIFLFNGAQINIKDKVKLVQDLVSMGNTHQNVAVIVVVDTKNLIGS